MSIECSTEICNPTSTDHPEDRTPSQVAQELEQLGHDLQEIVAKAAKEGISFDSTERNVWVMIRKAGFQAMKLLIMLQGQGDLGDHVDTSEGKTLYRSNEPGDCWVRSIFGQHDFKQYTYSPGVNKKIEFRPISARLQLPENRWSYLLQEFSQMFCVDQAFNQSADNLGTVLGGKFSVDTLEQTSQRMGEQADVFLDELPTPDKKDEAAFMVALADCKGVPLIKAEAAKVACFETTKKRPGNRRMATVTSVYTVDAHIRTAEQVVAALFRDKKDPDVTEKSKKRPRPRPKNKHTSAHFPTTIVDGDAEVPISGIHEGMAWLGEQVSTRRKQRQVLILLMDGQESLWDAAKAHFTNDQRLVEILDIIHVASYVWEASALFHQSRDERAAFTRKRLLKILRGGVSSVIRGLRRMGSLVKLKGEKLKDLQRICGYFEKHRERMRYDEYLAAGYPIASGVIEGACGHLVKDRMERSGMRWTLEGARSMLNVRAVFQSDYWNMFCEQRVAKLSETAHPHRDLLHNYTPLALAC